MTQQPDRRRAGLFPSWLLWPVLAAPLLVFLVSTLPIWSPIDTSCRAVTELLERLDIESAGSDPNLLVIGGTRLKAWNRRSGPEVPRGEYRLLAAPELTVATVAGCFQRSVAHYRPATTLLLVEDTEVLADPQALLRNLDELEQQRTYWSVSPHLVIATPAALPAVQDDAPDLQRFRQELSERAVPGSGTRILNLDQLFTGEDGKIDPELFWPDGQTLTREGYQRLETYFFQLAGAGAA